MIDLLTKRSREIMAVVYGAHLAEVEKKGGFRYQCEPNPQQHFSGNL